MRVSWVRGLPVLDVALASCPWDIGWKPMPPSRRCRGPNAGDPAATPSSIVEGPAFASVREAQAPRLPILALRQDFPFPSDPLNIWNTTERVPQGQVATCRDRCYPREN